jgi:hypothetical protein
MRIALACGALTNASSAFGLEATGDLVDWLELRDNEVARLIALAARSLACGHPPYAIGPDIAVVLILWED